MKIGNYSIPTFRLAPLIEATKKIYEKFPNEEIGREDIAHLLGIKPSSGGFAQKMADMRSYGLISGRGTFVVTKLGKDITFGTDDEKAIAHRQAVENIPLWKDLLDKEGVTLDKGDFWVVLRKITNAEAFDAQKKADSVRKAYMSDVANIKTVEKPVETSVSTPQQGEATGRSDVGMEPVQTSTGSIGYIGFPEYSRAPIEIKDEVSYNIAKQFLDAIGQKLKAKQEETEEPEESEESD